MSNASWAVASTSWPGRKQKAVKLLDDRGAFVLRRSVEDVADAFGVSRITIYNYLNAIRDKS